MKKHEAESRNLSGREGRLAPARFGVIQRILLRALLMLLVSVGVNGATLAQDSESRRANSAIARQLSSPDQPVRRRAAEELARLAAVDQKKLLEGYYLQEKDRGVRLALDWALYRVGKADALYRLVRELDTSRHDQAVGYLRQLDSPALIYPLLKEQGQPARITVGLLEALADLGDGDTLVVIAPFRESFALGVAAAAENSYDTIEARIAQTEPTKPSRPRTVSKTESTSP